MVSATENTQNYIHATVLAVMFSVRSLYDVWKKINQMQKTLTIKNISGKKCVGLIHMVKDRFFMHTLEKTLVKQS